MRVRILDEVSTIARERTSEVSRRGHVSVRISVIARVPDKGSLFQSFLYTFAGGWLLSAMAGCP